MAVDCCAEIPNMRFGGLECAAELRNIRERNVCRWQSHGVGTLGPIRGTLGPIRGTLGPIRGTLGPIRGTTVLYSEGKSGK